MFVYIKWEGPGWYGPYCTQDYMSPQRETWFFISRCQTGVSEMARQEGLGSPRFFDAAPLDMVQL